MDLIDRQEAIKAIKEYRYTDRFFPSYAVSALKELPSADAEPVRHGRWIGISDGYADGYPVYDEWECSECGVVFEDEFEDVEPRYKYCPNCGAKMDEKATRKTE